VEIDKETQIFYDQFWPRNVPIFEETRRYMLGTLREEWVTSALDAGCGHGLCTAVLAERSTYVTGVDISPACIETAKKCNADLGRTNVRFLVQDLQYLDLPDASIDLVWCWGVAMMAPDPLKVMREIMRVTRSGGVIYLGLYLKTWLSPVHQAVRQFCRTYMNTPRRKQLVLDFFSWLTKTLTWLKGQEINIRADNISIQTQVEDWYYAPYKKFYSIGEILCLLESNGFSAECIQERLGRMRSATIFVVRGVKE
jgi:2-polyprenyl-6-hydroxyphenyl methylase/3-demethylubiquinone-9 3-methyltransferase